MTLQYLIFDPSDDGEGTGTWDAMASVRSAQVPAVLAEMREVLQWAEMHAPGPRGPLDEGGAWDADEQVQADNDSNNDSSAGGWTTVTLTLTGPWEWGEALVAHFSPSDD